MTPLALALGWLAGGLLLVGLVVLVGTARRPGELEDEAGDPW